MIEGNLAPVPVGEIDRNVQPPEDIEIEEKVEEIIGPKSREDIAELQAQTPLLTEPNLSEIKPEEEESVVDDTATFVSQSTEAASKSNDPETLLDSQEITLTSDEVTALKKAVEDAKQELLDLQRKVETQEKVIGAYSAVTSIQGQMIKQQALTSLQVKNGAELAMQSAANKIKGLPQQIRGQEDLNLLQSVYRDALNTTIGYASETSNLIGNKAREMSTLDTELQSAVNQLELLTSNSSETQ